MSENSKKFDDQHFKTWKLFNSLSQNTEKTREPINGHIWETGTSEFLAICSKNNFKEWINSFNFTQLSILLLSVSTAPPKLPRALFILCKHMQLIQTETSTFSCPMGTLIICAVPLLTWLKAWDCIVLALSSTLKEKPFWEDWSGCTIIPNTITAITSASKSCPLVFLWLWDSHGLWCFLAVEEHYTDQLSGSEYASCVGGYALMYLHFISIVEEIMDSHIGPRGWNSHNGAHTQKGWACCI